MGRRQRARALGDLLVIYQLLFALVLRRLDPERAHALARHSLRLARMSRLGRALVQRLTGRADRSLETRALGLTFPTPVGVAAGVDKDAGWYEDLGALGFGFVEVGTVTALPQEGNSRPRIARFLRDRAILNRMGFPNPGADAVAQRLAGRTASTIVGVNVGKSKAVPLEGTSADYRAAVRRVGPLADFLVVNVSSPNTPGLRALQAVETLGPLLENIRDELRKLGRSVPVLVKIAPDLDDDEIDAVARLALESRLDGIVAVNTTVDRALLHDQGAAPFEGGGVSGSPLRPRSLEVLRRLRAATGDRLVLVSVGGVETVDDVWQRIHAGATLVQVYTALVYHGPGWPRRINRELARRVRDGGVASIQDLVGREEAAPRPAGPTRAYG